MVALFFKSLTSYVLTWDEAAMDFWEDAIKGSSALRAGLYRRLTDECTCALGLETASIDWDVEKFYDSVSWAKLFEWALDLSFPPQLLLVVASIHAAPRIIRVGRVYAQPHFPSNSLVAGCISAIWMSRIFVCSILAEVHALSPLRSRNFYDDIVSRISGTTG